MDTNLPAIPAITDRNKRLLRVDCNLCILHAPADSNRVDFSGRAAYTAQVGHQFSIRFHRLELFSTGTRFITLYNNPPLVDISMRVLAWNVQGAVPPYGIKDRIRQQIEFIETNAELPEVLMLNEVTTAQRDLWHESLQDIGYSRLVDTLDWAKQLGDSEIPPYHDANHVNGNLTAIHDEFNGENLTRLRPSIWSGPWEDADLKDWDTNLPEKILHAQMEVADMTIDLWNIRAVPGSSKGEEKVKILENVYNRIMKGCEPPCILTGDFNAPAREHPDGTTIPTRHDMEGPVARRWDKAELNILTGLEEMGMVDVFRAQHGYGDLNILDVSHPKNNTEPLQVPPGEVEGRRIDHLIASRDLNPQECRYDQCGFACSDHAPIIATFRV